MRGFFDFRLLLQLLFAAAVGVASALVLSSASAAVAVPGISTAPHAALAATAVPPILVAALCFVAVHRRMKTFAPAVQALRSFGASDLGDLDIGKGGVPALARTMERAFAVARDRTVAAIEDQEHHVAQNRLINYHKRCAERALEALPDGVLIMDEAGTATFANTKVAALTGVEIDDIVGSKPHDWCNNAEVVTLLGRYHSNVTRLRRSDTVEYAPAGRDDQRISAHAIPMPAASGGTATLVVFRDVSRTALIAKSRDDFVAHVAHELKSPLNLIRMHCELLGEIHGGGDAEATDALNVIEDQVSRLANLINDALRITQLEAGTLVLERDRVKLQNYLEDCFDQAARAAEEQGLTARLELPPRLPNIALDKELFRIVINNLLNNAVKYNRADGSVVLRAEETDDAVVIQVVDSGLGIPEDARERIFDKFYRADDEAALARGGHGLGLCLAREIVALHNGRLSVESTLGEGSTFTIELRKTAHLLAEAS